eukprot:PhF_6_TR44263/c0_g1_i1/m.68174
MTDKSSLSPSPYPIPKSPQPGSTPSTLNNLDTSSSQRRPQTPGASTSTTSASILHSNTTSSKRVGAFRRIRCHAATSAEEMQRVLKAMNLTQEDVNDIPRFDTWPASASITDENAQALMKSVLLTKMESLIDTRLGEVVSKFKPGAPPPHLRIVIFRDALAMYIAESKTFGPILRRILHELDMFMESDFEMVSKLQQSQAELVTVNAQYTKIVGELQLGYRHMLQDHKDIISTQEVDMKQSRILTDLLAQKNIEWRNELSQAQAKIVDRERSLHGATRELEYKRAAIKELMQRNQALVDENQYLKNICKHNKDLMEETATCRRLMDALTSTNVNLEQKLKVQSHKEQKKSEAFNSTIRNLKRGLAAKDTELKVANEKVSSIQSLSSTLRNQRDRMMVAWTPRPHMAPLQSISWLQRNGVKLSGRTVTAIQELVDVVKKMSEASDKMEKDLAAYQSLMYYLDDKDLARAQQDGGPPPPILSVISLGTHHSVPKF